MKPGLYTTILICSILLLSCGEETPKKQEASAEHTSIKTPSDKNQGKVAEVTEVAPAKVEKTKTESSTDSNPTTTNENPPTKTKGTQNFDPNADHSYYNGNANKGGTKKNDTGVNVDPTSGGVPQMTFEDDLYYFGTVKEGENVTHEFKFTNTGTGDLVISNATANCGCTEPNFSFLPIKPNETSTISVTFKTAGREGPQSKAVTITSNAHPKIRKVYLEGKVIPK
jgi:hypothetical protein